ncbi:MAG: hypothetical protein HY331_00920 [Chloroflexi bacterium]|nr:hypothetical protein [Chloroflexota bacterium]
MPESETTAEIIIERSRGDAYRYEYDQRRERPRVGPFLVVFAAIRQLLSMPYSGAGEPLYVRVEDEVSP